MLEGKGIVDLSRVTWIRESRSRLDPATSRLKLHLPVENCNFANILPVVKDLLEQNETNHCSNGLSIVESTSSQM